MEAMRRERSAAERRAATQAPNDDDGGADRHTALADAGDDVDGAVASLLYSLPRRVRSHYEAQKRAATAAADEDLARWRQAERQR